MCGAPGQLKHFPLLGGRAGVVVMGRATYRLMWDQASACCKREDDCSCTSVWASVTGSVGFVCF